MDKPYDIIYSLGHNCACAMYLRKFSLRRTSGVFDWLAAGDPDAPFVFLANGFEGFFEKDDFVPTGESDRHKHMSYYRNTRSGYLFLHDFTCDTPFDESFALNKKKYERRIARLVDNIQNQKNTLLILHSDIHAFSDEKIAELCERVIARHRRGIDFLFIQMTKDGESKTLALPHGSRAFVQRREPPENAADADAAGAVVPADLFWDFERVAPIYRRLRIRVPLHRRLRFKALCALFRFFSLFIPNRNKRHEFIEKHVRNRSLT